MKKEISCVLMMLFFVLSASMVNAEDNSATEGNDLSSDFEEIMLVDYDDFAVKITGMDENSDACTLYIHLENRSSDMAYDFDSFNPSINGLVFFESAFYETVEPGTQTDTEIIFDGLSEYGIERVTDIELELSICESADPNDGEDLVFVNEVYDEIFHFYPHGEENVVRYEREAQESDIVLLDTYSLTLSYTGLEEEDGDFIMSCFVSNKSNVRVDIIVDDMLINGHAYDCDWEGIAVNPDNCEYLPIKLVRSGLDESSFEISDISEIEMNLQIYGYDLTDDDWTYDCIFDDTVRINP